MIPGPNALRGVGTPSVLAKIKQTLRVAPASGIPTNALLAVDGTPLLAVSGTPLIAAA